MELGAVVPQIGPMAAPQVVVDFCRAADVAGFDGIWFADHVVVPETIESFYTLRAKPAAYPFEELRQTMGLNLELNTSLAVAAAVTERVKLCTGIAILPIRNPILNARQLASIDQFSGGRLVYGVGVGWLKEEADAMGMPWDRRGARTDEHIALLRTIWCAEGDTVAFDGEFYRCRRSTRGRPRCNGRSRSSSAATAIPRSSASARPRRRLDRRRDGSVPLHGGARSPPRRV